MTLKGSSGEEGRGLTAELVISEMVRDWTSRTLPGDPDAGEAAVNYALERFAAGASVSEACATARRMVLCRSRHPSAKPRRHLAVAS